MLEGGAHFFCECLQSGAEPRLGEETTDESEGEASHYSARRKEILDNAATVFADASEEFGALPTVKQRLEAWKAAQGGAAKTPEPRNQAHLFQIHAVWQGGSACPRTPPWLWFA